MSSKSGLVSLARCAVFLLSVAPCMAWAFGEGEDAHLASERAWNVVTMHAAGVSNLWGCAVGDLTAWSCGAVCRPMLLQVDECDPLGRWVLDVGENNSEDETPGALDETDVILFQVADLGRELTKPPLGAEYAVRLLEPSGILVGSFYLGCVNAQGPNGSGVPARVLVDPQNDRVQMRHGAVGFAGPWPVSLTTDGSANLLDRVKLRARADFLFGLVRVERDESHVQSRILGWRVGPLRAIRAQEQWVFLGWGLRTPIIRAYAFFYPNYLEVPVALRLRFPATYFFSDVRVRAYADFRALRGWQLLLPGDPILYSIDGFMTPSERALAGRTPDWFALRGPTVTLLQVLEVSDSLQSVRRGFFYNDDQLARFPPESVPGEMPGVGYELTRWEHVGAGLHSLRLTSFILPNSIPPERVIAARSRPLRVEVVPLRSGERRSP